MTSTRRCAASWRSGSTSRFPSPAAREALFKIFLTDIFCQDDVSVQVLMNSTEGYSGADVHLICREASMQPVRRLLRDKTLDKTPQDIMQMRAEGTLQAPPVRIGKI